VSLDQELAAFYDDVARANLQPLWRQQRNLMPHHPQPETRAWLWQWKTLRALAERAGDLITIERGGDRRVLSLANPGLAGQPFATPTLWGAVQYLGGGRPPSERADRPVHHHRPAHPGGVRPVPGGGAGQRSGGHQRLRARRGPQRSGPLELSRTVQARFRLGRTGPSRGRHGELTGDAVEVLEYPGEAPAAPSAGFATAWRDGAYRRTAHRPPAQGEAVALQRRASAVSRAAISFLACSAPLRLSCCARLKKSASSLSPSRSASLM
jgi:hypothetical protein